MERLDLTAEQVLTTTRAVRRRLDLERPVEREVVEACLRIAFQAPNGSDQQTWGWVVVDDRGTKVAMAGIYRAALADYVARPRTPSDPRPPSTPKQQRMAASVMYLTEHFEDVPVLLVPTFHGRAEERGVFWQASRWGSIAPGVWSFMLALRLHGLGSAWTTLHLLREREMGELLGIPDTETQAGMFPVAYTIGTDFKVADRSLSEARIRWDHW
ncbi:MAG TPA: nitroreductase family protein [Acidimicrobiales bacterium]|nr:nitroreductase family protein [Acidimicrobiales bacterium]